MQNGNHKDFPRIFLKMPFLNWLYDPKNFSSVAVEVLLLCFKTVNSSVQMRSSICEIRQSSEGVSRYTTD